jgi:hypothetical protein
MDTGIGPTGCEGMLSIVTSSLLLAKSRARLKTISAKTSLKCKSGEIITGHINPEIVFRRALLLANSRDDVTIDNIPL